MSKTIEFKGEEEIECNLEQHASPIGHRWSTWVQNVPGLGCRITLSSCSKRSLLAFLKGWALPRGAGSSCWFGGAIASAGTGAVECAEWDSEPWVYLDKSEPYSMSPFTIHSPLKNRCRANHEIFWHGRWELLLLKFASICIREFHIPFASEAG